MNRLITVPAGYKHPTYDTLRDGKRFVRSIKDIGYDRTVLLYGIPKHPSSANDSKDEYIPLQIDYEKARDVHVRFLTDECESKIHHLAWRSIDPKDYMLVDVPKCDRSHYMMFVAKGNGFIPISGDFATEAALIEWLVSNRVDTAFDIPGTHRYWSSVVNGDYWEQDDFVVTICE
jgi:hypothetical protein